MHLTDSVKDDLNSLLEVPANGKNLITALDAAPTPRDIINGWAELAAALVEKYRFSLTQSKSQQDNLIEKLIRVEKICAADVLNQIPNLLPSPDKNLEPIAKVSELPFMITEYYGANDDDEQYKFWMGKTGRFMGKLDLMNHIIYAKLLENKAIQMSRRAVQGNHLGLKSTENCIAVFCEALGIYKENNITLAGTARITEKAIQLYVNLSKLKPSNANNACDTAGEELLLDISEHPAGGYESALAIKNKALAMHIDTAGEMLTYGLAALKLKSAGSDIYKSQSTPIAPKKTRTPTPASNFS